MTKDNIFNSDNIDDATLEESLRSLQLGPPSASPVFRQNVMAILRDRSISGKPAHSNSKHRDNKNDFLLSLFMAGIVTIAVYLATIEKEVVEITPASLEKVAMKPVRFTLTNTNASEVHIAGSFSHWQASHALHRDSNGVWSVEIPLKPGRYEYVFVINNRKWTVDPGSNHVQNDGLGGKNSVVIVTDGKYVEDSPNV